MHPRHRDKQTSEIEVRQRISENRRRQGEGRRMGGWGSGRSGGRPTVESCLTLDLNELLRGGLIRPMTSLFNATLVWRNIGTGEETSRIGYAAHLEEKSGHMRLKQ